jgi:hypothetical protein
MEPPLLSAEAFRLVRTMQRFGPWVFNGRDLAHQELLKTKLARLDITGTHLVLAEIGRTAECSLKPAQGLVQFWLSAAGAKIT